MSVFYTLEIEHRYGEDIDMDAVCAALEAQDIKVRSTQPGLHMLSRSSVQRAREQFELACSLFESEEEDEG